MVILAVPFLDLRKVRGHCRRAPQRSRKLCAFGLGAACHCAEHFAGAGGSKLAHLGLNARAVRRYPRIAVNHAGIVHQKSKKRNFIKSAPMMQISDFRIWPLTQSSADGSQMGMQEFLRDVR